MATYYYDFSQAANGTGTTSSPFNGSVWPGAALAAGDTHLFKRGSSKTFAFTIGTAGTNGSPITFAAWYNADGSDDTTQAKPIITCTTQITQFGTSRDYIVLKYLDLRVSGIADANDKSLFFCGTGCTVQYCHMDCTSGCIGVWDKDNVTIDNNDLRGVSNAVNYNNQVIAVSMSAAHTNISITNNLILHYGGGSTTSHAVTITSSSTAITSLSVVNNTIRPNSGTYNANTAAYALRVNNASAANISYNGCTYHQVGIFVVSSTGCTIKYNACNFNYHFGIQITTNTSGFDINHNTCSDNGTSAYDGTVLMAYGRGIELSSASGQGSCSGHTLSFNTCQRNKNYGGPNDNASEGVGIGLDDGTSACVVQQNTCTDNEGNGIQVYGGGNAVTFTDTHNTVVTNFFKNNCTANYINRRSGGTTRSGSFNADISISWMYGSTSLVSNNTFGGSTAVGISSDSHTTSATYANNIFLSIGHPIVNGGTPGVTDYQNNIYVSATQIYSQTGVDGNGAATFPALVYSGTNDKTTNPALDANYKIQSTGSSAYHAGANLISAYRDHEDKSFNSGTPSIGMYEYTALAQPMGGHERRALFHNRTGIEL